MKTQLHNIKTKKKITHKKMLHFYVKIVQKDTAKLKKKSVTKCVLNVTMLIIMLQITDL